MHSINSNAINEPGLGMDITGLESMFHYRPNLCSSYVNTPLGH